MSKGAEVEIDEHFLRRDAIRNAVENKLRCCVQRSFSSKEVLAGRVAKPIVATPTEHPSALPRWVP